MGVLLINKAIVSSVLQTAIGYDENEFNTFIQEAQDFDLKPLFCEEFFVELMKNYNDAGNWQKVIDGGTYDYDTMTGIEFRGLDHVLAYFAYARFILKSNSVSTSHGFHQKETPYSTPIPMEERRSMYYSFRKDANVIFEDVEKFIKRKIDLYPEYNCGDSCEVNRQYKSNVIQ